MLIFASRVIRSRMRCNRSSRNRAKGCWVLVSCSSVGLGLQEDVVTACHLGLQGSLPQSWFSLNSLSAGVVPQTPKTFKRIAHIVASLKSITVVKRFSGQRGSQLDLETRVQSRKEKRTHHMKVGYVCECMHIPTPNKHTNKQISNQTAN